jgi:hypothetical protein
MSCRQEASCAVEGRANVIVPSLFGDTGVKSHPHLHLARFLRPRLGVKRPLCMDASLQSLGSSGKGSLEGIAYHLVGIASIGFYGVTEYSFLA